MHVERFFLSEILSGDEFFLYVLARLDDEFLMHLQILYDDPYRDVP